MTPKERAELIAAKDAIIAAKDQTIIVLSDMVDDLRRRLPHGPVDLVEQMSGLPNEWDGPQIRPADRSMWASDGEEHIEALAEAGVLRSSEQAEAALQALGYSNTIVELVK